MKTVTKERPKVSCPETRRLERAIPGLKRLGLAAAEQPQCRWCPLNDSYRSMSRKDFNLGVSELRQAACHLGRPAPDLFNTGPCSSHRDELLVQGNGRNTPRKRDALEPMDPRKLSPATRAALEYAGRVAHGRGAEISTLDLLLGVIEIKDAHVSAALGDKAVWLAYILGMVLDDDGALHGPKPRHTPQMKANLDTLATKAIESAFALARNTGVAEVEPIHIAVGLCNRHDHELRAALDGASLSFEQFRDRLSGEMARDLVTAN